MTPAISEAFPGEANEQVRKSDFGSRSIHQIHINSIQTVADCIRLYRLYRFYFHFYSGKKSYQTVPIRCSRKLGINKFGRSSLRTTQGSLVQRFRPGGQRFNFHKQNIAADQRRSVLSLGIVTSSEDTRDNKSWRQVCCNISAIWML